MLLLPIQEIYQNTKNISIYISSFKIKFQSSPFFIWAATHNIKFTLVAQKTQNEWFKHDCLLAENVKILYFTIM